MRERLLGGLLCLAGWLALDIRGIDDTLAEHIGTTGGYPPNEVCKFLNECQWKRVGGTMNLHGLCPHPIADRTVEILVHQAQYALTKWAAFVDKNSFGLEGKPPLVRHLSSEDVRPSGQIGHIPYTRPHLQFQLSAREIRELLMGKKLYKEPDVAIRELYQNALDACRYADARVRYLKRMGKRSSWTGRISFRQGVDADTQRRFLECTDNGIGMRVRELTSCFARAGKRFADLPEFLEEQELWRKLDPPIDFYPNSQFGIGVLSYFMIADEMRITSCRMSEDGRPEGQLSAYIPGSGSLFQLNDLGPGTESGTTVRLYLRDDWEGDCIKTLNEWVVVAEYETTSINEILQEHSVHHSFIPKIGVDCVPNEERTFWWINAHSESKFYNLGEILSDGIRIKNAPDLQCNFIINLVGKSRRALSIDRTQFTDDIPLQVLQNYPLQNVLHITKLTALDYLWLWDLSRRWETLAKKIESELASKDARLPLLLQKPHIQDQKRFPISQIGIHEVDQEILVELDSSFAITGSIPALVFLTGPNALRAAQWHFARKISRDLSLTRESAIDTSAIIKQLGERHFLTWLMKSLEFGNDFVFGFKSRDIDSLDNPNGTFIRSDAWHFPPELFDEPEPWIDRGYAEAWLRDRSRRPIPIRLPNSVLNWADKKLRELIFEARQNVQANENVWTERGLRAATWISHGYVAPTWLLSGFGGAKVKDATLSVMRRVRLHYFLRTFWPRFRFWAATKKKYWQIPLTFLTLMILLLFLIWIWNRRG